MTFHLLYRNLPPCSGLHDGWAWWEGGAESRAGRTSALGAVRGSSCAFKAQAESQRPAGPGREAWPPHTCSTLRSASASKAGHPQKACSVAFAADGPRSRQLRENESRRQACSSNPFSLKHGQERGCGHRPNGALGLEISPFSSQKQIVKQLFKKKKIRKQTFGSI